MRTITKKAIYIPGQKDATATIQLTDSGKYELLVSFVPNPHSEGEVKNLRFRAKTVEELVPLSMGSVKEEYIRQMIRDIVYEAEDLVYAEDALLHKERAARWNRMKAALGINALTSEENEWLNNPDNV